MNHRDDPTTPHDPPGRPPDPSGELDAATAAIPIDAPGEPAVRSPSTIRMWAVVLSGPTVWIVHFMVVYLAAEASCESARSTQMSFVGETGLRVGIVAATVVAVVGLVGVGGMAWRRSLATDATPMYRVALLLTSLFVLATLVVGLSPLVLDPC
jgi:hypothetical protein